VLEQAALAPDDSALAVPQAVVRYAQAAPQAWSAQAGSVLVLADSLQDDLPREDSARAAPPEPESAEPEQPAAHSQLADSQACPS
jgi:hypothetical protein